MSKLHEVKLSQNAQAKRETVAEITEKLKNAQSVIVLSSSGVTVAEITALRTKFRQAGVEYRVLKNTLVRRALDDLGIFSLDLSKPITMEIYTDACDDLLADIKPFMA